MTTLPIPVGVSPATAYPVPRDVQLETGPWCPMDRTALIVERHGWACPGCRCWWDQHGRHGVWLGEGPQLQGDLFTVVDLGERLGPAGARWRRADRVLAATLGGGFVLGLGTTAGRVYAGEVIGPLLVTTVLLLVGLVLMGAGLVLARRWWTGSRPGAGKRGA